jgi:outer membrane protein assembly factor BamB
VSGSVVLLPCGGQMSAYSSVSGHRRRTRTLGSFVTNAAIANGVWYAGWLNFPAAENRLGAFRVSKGRPLWRTATPQALLDLVEEEGPAVAEGRVLWSFTNATLRTFALP